MRRYSRSLGSVTRPTGAGEAKNSLPSESATAAYPKAHRATGRAVKEGVRADEGEFQPFGELFKEAQNGVRARERERFYDLGEIEILSHNDAQAPPQPFRTL